ncbi:hypothetical protein B0H17DRAFT_1136909 [Mycena rosella]|uniref:Uncharacterized protein n=1 Tax=Mycena rosella TaxID=1033263 RepID=A0AAD7D9P1_MYCRO|nr:hypothetical protein B0H17DRAFT_1136909 [Mycena rosella]
MSFVYPNSSVLMGIRVLLATIKNLGGCPCPRCFVEKSQIPKMGTKTDMRQRQDIRQDTSSWRDKIEAARRWIFGQGLGVTSKKVDEDNLKEKSWVPTRFGTTDSYSTQIGELSHRLVKRFYARTNKRKYGKQIAAHERRRRVLRGIKQRMQDAASTSAAQTVNESDEQPVEAATPVHLTPAPPVSPPQRVVNNLRPEDEDLPRTPPRQHHHISESKRSPLDWSGMDHGNEAGDAAGTKGDDDSDSDTSDIEEEQQLEGEEELEEEEDTAVIGHNDDEILDAIGYDEL